MSRGGRSVDAVDKRKSDQPDILIIADRRHYGKHSESIQVRHCSAYSFLKFHDYSNVLKTKKQTEHG